MQGAVGEVHMVLTITNPGEEPKTVELVGKVTQEQAEALGMIQPEKEIENGSNAQ